MTVMQYLLILFGVFEIVSNAYHFSKRTRTAIGISARKQHQELTLSLPDIHFFWKAVIMFLFGVFFLAAGLISVSRPDHAPVVTWCATISLSLYGFVQALVYRKEIKVWSAMVVYSLPLILNMFLQ